VFPKVFSSQLNIINNGMNIALVERKNVRFAYAFYLPFRLLTGGFYRLSFIFKKKDFDVVLINRPINSKSEFEDIAFEKRHEVFTKLIILIENPRIEDNEILEVRNSKHPVAALFKNSLKAMEAFNHFLIAYSVATKRMTGLRPIRAFKKDDFFDSQTMILCEPEFNFTNDYFVRVSESQRFLLSRGLNVGGFSHDGVFQVTQEELDKIPIVLSRLDEDVHYELAFDAKSKMLDGDDKGALISAVTAFESVHSAFVQYELEGKLISFEDRKVDLIKKYIKSMGIYNGNYLTPVLFMDEAERPSMDIIENCAKAITLRNVFVHALKDSSGNIRTLINAELDSAYNAVLEVYELYVAALEKRIYFAQ